MDLFFKGSEDILEDPDDEPVSKKRISDSDEKVCCLLSLLSLRWAVVLLWFQTPWVRPQPFLHVLINLRLTTSILQTSGVPTLLMWTFTVLRFLRSALLT